MKGLLGQGRRVINLQSNRHILGKLLGGKAILDILLPFPMRRLLNILLLNLLE
jgi:hypothetical protein